MREIHHFIYRITTQNMDVTFVECESFVDLCNYLASNIQYRIGCIAVHQCLPYEGLRLVDVYNSAEYKKATERFAVRGYRKATHIKWDTDGEDVDCLPAELDIPNDMVDEDEVSDYLSDVTGFCHKGFDMEYVTAEVVERFG